MHAAPLRMVSVPDFSRWGVLASLLVCNFARAEEQAPHEGPRALPAIVGVGVPVPSEGQVTFAGSAGYGYLDRALELESPGSRLLGSVGGAISVTPFLMLGADASGRIDLFDSADDRRTNMYGEPRLTGRFHMPATEAVFWGAELDARLIGSEAPDIDLAATSPSLRGLLGVHLARTTWLGAELGFHFNNSGHALSPASQISSADRITVGASSTSGVVFGVGVSHRLDFGLELLGEVSGEILVGAQAPAVYESPWGLSLGARHPLSEQLDLMLSADVSLSARPDFEPDTLVPIEPRAAALVTAIFRFGGETKQAPPAPPEKSVKEPEPEETDQEPEVPASSVKGVVVDEGGRPLADAEVTLKRPGAEPAVERTYANGEFEFKDVPEGPVQLMVKTPGYDAAELAFEEGEDRSGEVVLYPSLPAGQVKGQVRDLKGNPVAASIKVTPGDKETAVRADGTFELELAPGRYTVRFEHPDLTPQQRVIRVQDRGVVILNIALSP